MVFGGLILAKEVAELGFGKADVWCEGGEYVDLSGYSDEGVEGLPSAQSRHLRTCSA